MKNEIRPILKRLGLVLIIPLIFSLAYFRYIDLKVNLIIDLKKFIIGIDKSRDEINNQFNEIIKDTIDRQNKLHKILNISSSLISYNIYCRNNILFFVETIKPRNSIFAINKIEIYSHKEKFEIEFWKTKKITNNSIELEEITNKLKDYNYRFYFSDILVNMDSDNIVNIYNQRYYEDFDKIIFDIKPTIKSFFLVYVFFLFFLFAFYLIVNKLYKFIAFNEPSFKKIKKDS